MKTLIINGSPNAGRGNTGILSREFIKGMQNPPEVRYVAGEDPAALAAYMRDFDRLLFFFPLYVNAMPGILKRLFEHMLPDREKTVGFFVQSGFEEAAQSDYLVAILKNFIKRMEYRDSGIVIAGGMAGVRYMPERMNRKTFEHMRRAGALYEQSGSFADETVKRFGKLYRYSPGRVRLLRLAQKLGLADVFWNGMLKNNNAWLKRYDKPFGA